MAATPASTPFQENERVLCFHGPLIYEAKIQKVEIRDKQTKYFIHYHGWNKNWDEWVPEARMLKYTETNLEKRKSLVKANDANARAKKVAAKKKAGLPGTNPSAPTPPPPGAATTSASSSSFVSLAGSAQSLSPDSVEKVSAPTVTQDMLDVQEKTEKSSSSEDVTLNPPPEKQSRSSSRKSATPTSTTAKNNAKRVQVSAKEEQQRQAILDKPDGTVETEEQFYTMVEVRIKAPDELTPYLVDDWDYLTRQRKLVTLPARVTVDQLVQDYIKIRTSKAASASKINREAAILDVTAGLIEYFNVMLGSQLLYKFEREQHSDILKEHPDTPMCKIYGAIHLLRLFVKLGGMLTYTPLEAKSVHLLQFYINDFLQYMKKNASTLFTIQDYGTASPEYHRRSL